MSNNNNKYSSTKSCYRLYAGHGNWINLSAKTTQDLLQIFQKGVPCRYQLATGLYIDIIPHDVDCNSKNIDMFGLMRADLVYESQVVENHVQQLMSHYIRGLLDEQGIIDAFPPLRSGEDLPIITSIPTHRHLSLVPSVVGAVRRGPKPNSLYNQQHSKASSSSSSVTAEDSSALVSSSNSSSSSSPQASRNRKKGSSSSFNAVTTTRRTAAAANNKRTRQNTTTIPSIEMVPTKRQQLISSELPGISHENMQLFGQQQHHQQQHYLNTPTSSTSEHQSVYHHNTNNSYGVNPMLPMTFSPAAHQNSSNTGGSMWMPSYQNSSPSRPTTAATNFNFEFGMDFDDHQNTQQRQSPTDILHEYDNTYHPGGFEGELYSNTVVHHSLLDESSHMAPPATTNTTTAASDSNESYVPTSPTTWNQQQQQQQQRDWDMDYNQQTTTTMMNTEEDNQQQQPKSILTSIPIENNNNGSSKTTTETDSDMEDNQNHHHQHFFKNEEFNGTRTTSEVTTLPMDRLLLSSSSSNNNSGSNNNNNSQNLILSHHGDISTP